ncbi:uncharacterized protein [Procambarus clarkii]|uniref:uncharacterized protein isoform X2 n=1 Tax=Procambarus clarkii TaxID=6728 RepID=UPI001E6788B3|nr:uncharacterized protein LOC123752455 [Procambarus clarkii]
MMSILQSYSGLRQSGRTLKIQALVWVCLGVWVASGAGGECPKVCECKWKDGKETVACIGAEFIDIPRNLDPSTQVLDLKHNNLQILPRDAFVDTGLVNLQKLWLNYCNLKHMDRGAFNMLANLVELDLSHNLLRSVPTAALIDISGLRELRLASNALTIIPADAFAPVPDLVHLDLSHNRIHSVDPKAFRCLSMLEILKFSSNMLVHLFHEFLIPLKALHGLNLNENPWNCNCSLRPLRQWMLNHKISSVVPPICARPKRLNTRSWQTMTLDEFVCMPQITAITLRVLASRGDNVSLVCRVEKDFEVSITWLHGDRFLKNTNEARRYRVLDMVASNNSMLISNLTIMGVAPRDQGTYKCIAENKAGRSESSLILKVTNDITEVKLVSIDKAYMTGGLLSGLGLLVMILLLVSCIIHRRQRVQRFRRQEEDREGRVVQGSTASSKQTGPISKMQRKPSDYHVIPSGDSEAQPIHPVKTRESWMPREVVNGGYPRASYLENGRYDDSSLERYRDAVLDDLREQQVSPSSISYVDLAPPAPPPPPPPPTEISRRRSDLGEKESLKNLEFETDILRRECSPTGSTVSVVSNGQLTDILNLPYSRRRDHQSFQAVDFNTIAKKHRPMFYDERSRERVTYDPCSLNGRCYSALNLAMSEAASHAFCYPRGRHASTRYPSLPSTPMLDPDNRLAHVHDARRLRRLMAANRGVYRSLEGTGDLSSCYRYQYHAAQLENYLKEYRNLQKRLYRMKESRDPVHRGGSSSRLTAFTDSLDSSGKVLSDLAGSLSHDVSSSLTRDIASSFARDIASSLNRDIAGSLSRTGSLNRDVTGSLSRVGSLTRDVTAGLSRAGSLTRDVTAGLGRADSLTRDVAGVSLFPGAPSSASPPSPYRDRELGLPRRRARAATEPLLEVAHPGVLAHRKSSLGLISGATLGHSDAVREVLKGRTRGPSDSVIDAMHSRSVAESESMIDAMQSRALGGPEGVRDAIQSRGMGPTESMLGPSGDVMVDMTSGDSLRPSEPLRSILKNRYEGGGLLYQGKYSNSAYYDDDDDDEGPTYSPAEYKDYLDHGS